MKRDGEIKMTNNIIETNLGKKVDLQRISEGSASPITKAGAFYVFSVRISEDDVVWQYHHMFCAVQVLRAYATNRGLNCSHTTNYIQSVVLGIGFQEVLHWGRQTSHPFDVCTSDLEFDSQLICGCQIWVATSEGAKSL